MISSVANNASLYSGLRSAAAPRSKADFGAMVQTASSATGDIASISQDAKAKSASAQVFDFDFSYNNIDHTQEEYKAHYAEGARRISEMQGLPEGQYDFTKLSGKQAQVVMSDAILNHGATWEDTLGLGNFVSDNVDLSGSRPIYLDTTKNVISHILSQQVSFPDVNGGKFGVPEKSLEWVMSITKSSITNNHDDLIYNPSIRK